MSDHSFFHLTPPPPIQRLDWGPWETMDVAEFDAAHEAAQPLADLLHAAIDAYVQEHHLSMIEAWMAADMVRYSIGCQIQEDSADA